MPLPGPGPELDDGRVVEPAEPGDGVLFDCRNFHQVQDFEGGRRITLSLFLGFTMNGELVAWS
ncbi:hypothetical protein [Kitasatospora sp. NPDC097691]|uniref:hypothetical protein n=1 Tax=Kitasatospora sp. NPDC097691 TaxID=3157231 RepID=UPI00332273C9